MRRRSKTISKTTVLLLLSCLGLSSCYEATEACLDSNATNFDVYADENCCCTYPILNVNIIKQVDGVQYTSTELLADTFTNTIGQRYQISAQSFYISNLFLTYDDGTMSQVLDTLERPIPQDSDTDVVIEDNFGLVRQSSASYSAGHIQENGSITKVSFTVGLTDQIDMLVPDQLPSIHPLGSNNESDHYVEGIGYIYIRWVIKPIEISGVEEITVTLSGISVMEEVSLDAALTTSPGITTQVPLVIDYGKWLEGIDFAADQSIIDAKVAANTTSAFSIQ